MVNEASEVSEVPIKRSTDKAKLAKPSVFLFIIHNKQKSII